MEIFRRANRKMLPSCLARWQLLFAVIFCSCHNDSPSPSVLPPEDSPSGHVNADEIGQRRGAVGSKQPVVTGIAFRHDVLSGVQYENGSSAGFDTILETLGGGVAAFDYDGDGWLDLLFPGGGRYANETGPAMSGLPLRLLRGGAEGSWSPVEEPAGFGDPAAYSHGFAAADFNNDGFVDFVITGYGGVQVYCNRGDGTYADCTRAAGISDRGWSTSAAWGDLDGDGALDLFLVHYVEYTLALHQACVAGFDDKSEICGPRSYEASDDRVYMNRGDGTFDDATAAVGLKPGGKGLGVVMGDVDLDGDLDVYVANDTTENFLYLNDGTGRLREVGVLHGAAYNEDGVPNASMGVALADFDGDGLPDLWTTTFEHEAPALYRNLGEGQFHHASRLAGVTAISDEFVGWGTGFADFDGDGDLDAVIANGHLPKYRPPGRIAQRLVLLQSDGRGLFREADLAIDGWLSVAHTGRGLALGDFDRDGRLDLAISCLDEPAAVLWNRSAGSNRALRLRLVGTRSNRDAVGAFAVLETTAGPQLREVVGGGSYLSQSDLTLHWGYAAETGLQRLTIHWPSGLVQALMPPFHDDELVIIEPLPDSN